MPHGNTVFAGKRCARKSNWWGSAGAIGTQSIRPRIDRYQQGLRWSPTPPLTFGVYGSAPLRNRTSSLSNTTPWRPSEICSVFACQEDVFHVVNPFLIFISDVSRAHFYANEVRDVYVSLPYENSKSNGLGVSGKMPKTLHGALVAALSSTSWYMVTIFSPLADRRSGNMHGVCSRRHTS